MRDASAGTSLLQSQPEIDHRDQHHHHLHKHDHLHRRQQADTLPTAITSTISVIQEVIVDQNGSTFLKTILAASPTVDTTTDPTVPPSIDDTVSVPPAVLAVPPSPLNKPAPILDAQTTSAVVAASSTADAPLFVNTSPPLPVASTPFLGSSNSSIPAITGSSSPESTLTSLPYRTTSSPTRSSKTGSTKVRSSTSTETISSISEELSSSSSSSSSISSPSDSLFSSDSPTATNGFAPGATSGGIGGGGGQGAGGATFTGSTTATTTTASGGAGGSSDGGQSTPTPVVVGGVVGAIAGVVFIIALVMVFVRWRKRKQSLLPLGSSENTGTGPSATESSGGSPSQPREMTKRPTFAIPATLASLTGYKRSSHQPSMDHSSTAGSEQGFYKVSGRKLPSVFQHGGDGYGGGHESLGGSSFYRDSQGLHGGPGSPTSPFANRESGIPITRPSPARTPVISESGFAPPSPAPTSPAPSPMLPPRRPDGLGRSHPSRDGSHASKFTEQV